MCRTHSSVYPGSARADVWCSSLAGRTLERERSPGSLLASRKPPPHVGGSDQLWYSHSNVGVKVDIDKYCNHTPWVTLLMQSM